MSWKVFIIIIIIIKHVIACKHEAMGHDDCASYHI